MLKKEAKGPMINMDTPQLTSEFDWDSGEDAFPSEHAPLVADRRTEARIYAGQALFNALVMERHPLDVLEEFEKKIGRRKADKKLFRLILTEAANTPERYKTLLEQEIREGWTWSRTDPVLRALAWAGAAELTAHGDVSIAVILNEYINISKGFIKADEVSYLHRILDSVAKKVRGTL